MKFLGTNFRIRFWLALILFLAGIALLLFASLPTTRVQQVQELPPVLLPSPTPVSLFLVHEEI